MDCPFYKEFLNLVIVFRILKEDALFFINVTSHFFSKNKHPHPRKERWVHSFESKNAMSFFYLLSKKHKCRSKEEKVRYFQIDDVDEINFRFSERYCPPQKQSKKILKNWITHNSMPLLSSEKMLIFSRTNWLAYPYKMTYQEMIWGSHFQKGVWCWKLPKSEKDIIVIFKKSFSALNTYGSRG